MLLKLLKYMIFILITTNVNLYSNAWKTSLDSVKFYYNNNQNAVALTWGERAKHLSDSLFGKVSPEYEQTLYLLVDLYFYNNDLKAATATAKEDSSISKAVYGKISQQYSGALNNLGLIYYYVLGDHKQAIYVLNEAKIIQENKLNPSDSAYAFTLNNLALVYEVLGEFIKAEPLYEIALDLVSRSIGEKNDTYALMVHNLAGLYKLMGKYEKSDTLFRKSLELNKKIKGELHPDIANEFNNIAELYKLMGRYDEAEPLYEQAVKLRKQVFGTNHHEYAKSLSSLALLYHSMGRYDNAESLFKEAIQIQKEQRGEEHTDYAGSLNNLALLYETMGNFEEAERLYINVLNIFKKTFGENHFFYAASLDNLAKLYRKMGIFDKAENLFNKTMEIRKNTLGEDHPIFARTLFNLAKLYEIMGKFNQAEPLYKRALKLRIDKLGEEHPDCALSMAGLALLYKKMGEYEKAEPYFQGAINKYLNQVKRYFPYLSEKEKLEFWMSVRKTFEDFDAFSTVYYKINPVILTKMFNNRLATKGLILSSTKKVLSNIRNSQDSSVVNLLNIWQNTKDNWLWMTQNPDQANKQDVDLDSIAEYANELEKKLSSKSEDFRKAFDAKDVYWTDIRDKLNDGEAAIEIVRLKINNSQFNRNIDDTIYYAALIVKYDSKFHPEIAAIKNGNDLESKYIKLYGNLVKILRINLTKNKTSLEDQLMEKDQFDLFNQFWAEIQNKLENINKIYLSVDGVYNSINLQTLKNPKTGKYLLEEIDIRLVTNTKDILDYEIPSKTYTKNTAEIFGNPLFNLDPDKRSVIPQLPGAETEAKQIANALIEKKWYVQIHTGENALEERIKKVVSPKILHIATHGIFLQDAQEDEENSLRISASSVVENPLIRSMLIFAGIENDFEKQHGMDDGKLTAYEVMNLNLDNTALVVMSACETGLGEIKNGEGVYGLQRAFQVAGAASLVMSLWTVSDAATQKLMALFYEKIINGMDKRLAFRNSQIELKESFPDFYYWGAFVMVGE